MSQKMIPKETTSLDGPHLLTPVETSRRISVSVKTLANWRSLNEGPRWVKLRQRKGTAGAVRYDLRELERFCEVMTVNKVENDG